jgi:ppGpp synthetase/RelA/SpoT-type nucleotidyltranferase
MSQLINRFVEDYENNLAVHEQIASAAEQRCRDLLEGNHIPAVITSRAKCPTRLREKLEKRNPELHYRTEADIQSNIPDLSGVRIALYFPSQQKDVIQLLQQIFVPILVKTYDSTPESEHSPHDSPQESPEEKESVIPDVPTQHIFRPTGYHAVHLHMCTRTDDTFPKHSPTAEAAVFEVQITTLLMHAWSEVDHDLAYKYHGEEPSNEETRVLSEINRNIVASEGLLRQLEELVRNRNVSRRTN